MEGDVLDPDGEDVSLSLVICGYPTNDFTREQGKSGWSTDVNIVACSSQNPPVTSYDVTITATDESGSVTIISVFVPDPYGSTDNTQSTDSDSNEVAEEGLPAVSMLATLSVTLLGAVLVGRQRKD